MLPSGLRILLKFLGFVVLILAAGELGKEVVNGTKAFMYIMISLMFFVAGSGSNKWEGD
jgi:hypothetical protein